MSQARVTSNLVLTLAGCLIIVAGLKSAATLVVPFLLALFIAMLCSPVVSVLTRCKIPGVVAVFAVVLFIVATGIGVLSFIGAAINDFYQDLPFYENRLQEQLLLFGQALSGFGLDINQESFREYINPSAAMKTVLKFFYSLGGALTNTFLVMFTVVFMLLEASTFHDKARRAFGVDTQAIERVRHFTQTVQRYFVIKTWMSIGTSLCVGVVLASMGVDYWLLWALLAFLFNYVPNIGSILAAIPAVLIALVQLGVTEALLVMLAYVLINTLFGNVIEPRYMGRSLGLSTLVVFLSLVVWGWVLGPVGMILSVPLTIIVVIALETRDSTRWLAILLGH